MFSVLFHKHKTKAFVRDTDTETDLQQHITRRTLRHRTEFRQTQIYIHTQMTDSPETISYRQMEDTGKEVDIATLTLLFVKLIQV